MEELAKEQELRLFSEITEKQVQAMWRHCVDAAIVYSDEINMSGLSDGNAHDIYTVLHDALFSEWERSKKAMNVTGEKELPTFNDMCGILKE